MESSESTTLISDTDKPVKIDDHQRLGLTTEQVEELVKEWGYNELPEIKISLWYILLMQFTGTMPYMLELAAIIAIAVQDFEDFGIILAMLLSNGFLGFHEQLKAAESLAELTNKMEQKIAVLRDGKAEQLLTRLLVPGDVVFLAGGCQVPADIEWIEGDVLSVDTAALTGEPLPRKYPGDHGNLILCACTVRAGEAYGIVRKTGINTEIGGANADIMKDKQKVRVSVFEQRVLLAVKVIISISLLDVIVIFFIQGFALNEFSEVDTLLLTCLSIIIAAIPVALPLVMQVTMALGAGKMAREFNSVVTALPALQDISSMTVLCSDKTGTLTTARISIIEDSVWSSGSFSKKDVALYGVLASNPDKKEDPIDRSVTAHFERVYGEHGPSILSEYTKTRNVGFNPIYKRVLYEYSHPKLGKITIAKGLPNKVLDTADGGTDDAADQWKVRDAEKLSPIVKKIDLDFSKSGYKTLGVVVKINDNPWEYCGILPMLDPPRHDTAETIRNLVNAGIEVKMITGDHLNIAKETARLIGLGVELHAGEEIRLDDDMRTKEAEHAKNELIRISNGFAQVLPRDKREVVMVLKDYYKQVCGMTGDGVNDAPALSYAQCGIAVDDATDAAKNAAAIILTSPGLSAIYSAVVESRRIFRKLKSYVTYRFAATIQIVIVLTLFIYISNCPINSLYIVLLALFNDLTMLPIAYDVQVASSKPENPDVKRILTVSFVLGSMQTFASMIFAYFFMSRSGWFTGDYSMAGCSTKTQGLLWVQMFIATELLIFSTRASKYIYNSVAPSIALTCSVLGGCLLVSLMAGLSSGFGSVPVEDILITWCYDLIVIVICDVVKVFITRDYFGENTDFLTDVVKEVVEEKQNLLSSKEGVSDSINTTGVTQQGTATDVEFGRKASFTSAQLAQWNDANSTRLGISVKRANSSSTNIVGNRIPSTSNIAASRDSSSISLTRTPSSTNVGTINAYRVPSATDLHASILSGSVRPRTPANKFNH